MHQMACYTPLFSYLNKNYALYSPILLRAQWLQHPRSLQQCPISTLGTEEQPPDGATPAIEIRSTKCILARSFSPVLSTVTEAQNLVWPIWLGRMEVIDPYSCTSGLAIRLLRFRRVDNARTKSISKLKA